MPISGGILPPFSASGSFPGLLYNHLDGRSFTHAFYTLRLRYTPPPTGLRRCVPHEGCTLPAVRYLPLYHHHARSTTCVPAFYGYYTTYASAVRWIRSGYVGYRLFCHARSGWIPVTCEGAAALYYLPAYPGCSIVPTWLFYYLRLFYIVYLVYYTLVVPSTPAVDASVGSFVLRGPQYVPTVYFAFYRSFRYLYRYRITTTGYTHACNALPDRSVPRSIPTTSLLYVHRCMYATMTRAATTMLHHSPHSATCHTGSDCRITTAFTPAFLPVLVRSACSSQPRFGSPRVPVLCHAAYRRR